MLTLLPAEKDDYKAIKKIYIRAFPAEERAPFFFIRRKARQGKAEMLAAKENGAVIGFAYLVAYRDLVYLFFLALSEEQRGKGHGSRILRELQERYRGKRMFLSREQLDPTAENYPERVSRRDFYIRGGFADMGCQVKEGKMTYDVMGNGGPVTAQEYDALFESWCGRFIKRVVVRTNFMENPL